MALFLISVLFVNSARKLSQSDDGSQEDILLYVIARRVSNAAIYFAARADVGLLGYARNDENIYGARIPDQI